MDYAGVLLVQVMAAVLAGAMFALGIGLLSALLSQAGDRPAGATLVLQQSVQSVADTCTISRPPRLLSAAVTSRAPPTIPVRSQWRLRPDLLQV